MIRAFLVRVGSKGIRHVARIGTLYKKKIRPWILEHQQEIFLLLLVIGLIRGCDFSKLHEIQHASELKDYRSGDHPV